MEKIRQELDILLRAIVSVRNKWLLEIKRVEFRMKSRNPKITKQEAFQHAILTKDVMEEYNKLLNLYSVLGNSAEEFLLELNEGDPSDDEAA